MPNDNANTVKLNEQATSTFFGTSVDGELKLRCGDCGGLYDADEADDRVCPAQAGRAIADGGDGGTWHVVCHDADCTFEEIVDDDNAPTGSPARDAGDLEDEHAEETDHRVTRERIDTGTPRLAADGAGINFYSDLTGFQQDILFVLRRIERGLTNEAAYGLGIKRELESLYGEEVNHGRLYPNLDDLVNKGLIEKEQADRRTNEYATTDLARELVESHARWTNESADVATPAADGGDVQ